MELFRDFEKHALNFLLPNILSLDCIDEITTNGELISHEYTGAGYFRVIRHDSLPLERITCHEPIVIGESGRITCGFVVFIEERQLTLECHSWGESEVPEDFRDEDVRVRQVYIAEGSFVDLKEVGGN
jgi:hypothetical protein